MRNLMGFRKVSKLPAPKGRSVYDPLLEQVREDGGMYSLDTQDKKRAYNLTSTIRQLIRKRGYDDLVAGLVGTTVYVKKKERHDRVREDDSLA